MNNSRDERSPSFGKDLACLRNWAKLPVTRSFRHLVLITYRGFGSLVQILDLIRDIGQDTLPYLHWKRQLLAVMKGKVMSTITNKYKGQCFCGAVEIEVTGECAGAGYCHCESCRSWSAGPVNAFTLWKTDDVKVTRGEENVGVYNKTERSYRKWCTSCGGHLMTEHPQWGLIDVFAATIPDFPFQAGVHVNYAQTVLPMKDGLPKLKDFPAELGGSGEVVPE